MYDEAKFEYFKMKCCSFQRPDLFKHYKEIYKRYHMLSGINGLSTKHAFISSLPKEISSQTFRLIKVKNKAISSTSLGEVFQHVLKVVEKLCS